MLNCDSNVSDLKTYYIATSSCYRLLRNIPNLTMRTELDLNVHAILIKSEMRNRGPDQNVKT
jgi:hypothetical protein